MEKPCFFNSSFLVLFLPFKVFPKKERENSVSNLYFYKRENTILLLQSLALISSDEYRKKKLPNLNASAFEGDIFFYAFQHYTYRVTNEEVLARIMTSRQLCKMISQRQLKFLGQAVRKTEFEELERLHGCAKRRQRNSSLGNNSLGSAWNIWHSARSRTIWYKKTTCQTDADFGKSKAILVEQCPGPFS